MTPGQVRNFLGQKINKYFSNSTHLKQKEEILKTYKDIIVSFMDGDDITHPQKFEILDHLYSVKQINGTVLHRLYRRDCHIITHKMKHALNSYVDKMLQNQRKAAHVEYINEDLMTNALVFYLKIDNNKLMNEILSTSLTRDVLITNFSYPGLNQTNMPNHWQDFHMAQHNWGSHYGEIKWKDQCGYANGWPTTTLQNILSNPYDEHMTEGEDINFNFKTALLGFDYYPLSMPLAVYCKDKE